MTTSISVRVDFDDVIRNLRRLGKAVEPIVIMDTVGNAQLTWFGKLFRSQGKLVGGWKPLAKSTKFARRGTGGGQILRDTGRLAQSFQILRGPTSALVEVGSKEKKAEWHNEGTKPFTIRPKNKKMLAFAHPDGGVILKKGANKGKRGVLARVVNHPGIPKRQIIPNAATINKIAEAAIDGILRKATKGFNR